MKSKSLLAVVLGLGLILILSVGIVSLSNEALAQKPVVQGETGVLDVVGTAFTYQGRLTKDGSSVNDQCDFQFSLWDAPLFGNQVGSTQTYLNQTVTDGYFTVSNVDFGADAFTGEGRALKVAVRCPAGSGSYTDLFPLTLLRPAPYALSLRPEAVISGSSGDQVLTVENQSTGHGLKGTTFGTDHLHAGVTGANQGTGVGSGVYGFSIAGYGVHGRATFGTGVYGTGPTTGTVGITTGSGGYGVYGYSASGHGVHGKANPPEGYGIYSEGNAYVEGELFWDAKTSYIAVATSAFIPELLADTGHVEYENEGYYLKNESDNAWFTALVQLPHDATVKELRVGWRDGSDETAALYLKRRSMLNVTQGAETMAQVTSVGSFGSIREGVWSDDTIDNATVNNENFTYFLEVFLPSTSEDVKLYGVVIVYEITQPY